MAHLTPPHGGPRQTRSYLKEMLEANGLRPRRQLGQCFLIDLNLLELIIDSARIGPDDVVLEVGSGTGGLTARLAERAAKVVSVEIDSGFHKLARWETRHCQNVTLLHIDVLKNKNRIQPEVLLRLRQAMEEAGASVYHLVANLPFDVAASVIGNLLIEELLPRSMTVTVQQEMTERITASPGSKNYGPISVLVQRIGSAELIRKMSPQSFWPRPKVHSAIIRIEISGERRGDLQELKKWYRFVRELFIHRRKTLRSAIASIPGYKRLKGDLDQLLGSIGLASDLRAERLTALRLHELYVALEKLNRTG